MVDFRLFSLKNVFFSGHIEFFAGMGPLSELSYGLKDIFRRKDAILNENFAKKTNFQQKFIMQFAL